MGPCSNNQQRLLMGSFCSVNMWVSTIECDATSISINSAPMSSSANVKLRYEKCLQVWGNAIFRPLAQE